MGQTEKRTVSPGDVVEFLFGTTQVRGVVIEDRGPLGAQGRRLFSIRFELDASEPQVIEMPEDEISLVATPAGS